MGINLKGRNFVKLLDYSPEEIRHLIETSKKLKKAKKDGVDMTGELKGKNIVLIFQKDSTRTRCAFETSSADLGMGVTYLGPTGSPMGKKESIEDTANVLGRMYDAIEFRGFKQTDVEILAKHAGVPVMNGLTDEWHPTQIIADFLTIEEHKGNVKGLKFVYFGDARNNMGHSLMIGCAKMGMNFVAAAPKALWPDEKIAKIARELAKESGSTIEFIEDAKVAAKDADVAYADVWVSMGESSDFWAKRIKQLKDYQVSKEVMAEAKDDAIFLHCLPAFHDRNTEVGEDIFKKFGMESLEVTDEVFRSKQSVAFQEAENRQHSIKAIIYTHLTGK